MIYETIIELWDNYDIRTCLSSDEIFQLKNNLKNNNSLKNVCENITLFNNQLHFQMSVDNKIDAFEIDDLTYDLLNEIKQVCSFDIKQFQVNYSGQDFKERIDINELNNIHNVYADEIEPKTTFTKRI